MAEGAGNNEPRAITVSRDALRADLAEMELRLRLYFDDQLRNKASAATVAEHALALEKFARGEFTEAQKNAIETVVENTLTIKTDRGWTSRERWFGIITILVALGSFLLAILAATHGWSG